MITIIRKVILTDLVANVLRSQIVPRSLCELVLHRNSNARENLLVVQIEPDLPKLVPLQTARMVLILLTEVLRLWEAMMVICGHMRMMITVLEAACQENPLQLLL